MPWSPSPIASQQLPALLASATQSLKAGRPAEAVEPLRKAAVLDPFNSAIQHDLGLACLETGNFTEAVTALRRAVEDNPRYADAWFRLGIALEKQGDRNGAIVAYDRATALTPSHAEAWFRAGAAVYMLGHREEAIGCFRRAAQTGGNTRFGRLGKARALMTEDRNHEAVLVLRKTLKIDPGDAMSYDLLGSLLAEFGQFEEARECFAQAIAHAPLLAGCYYDLVRCRPVTREEGLMPLMEAALATPALEAVQRVRLHLAMGKAADDLGDYQLAMQHFDAADELRRSTLPFDAEAFARETDQMISRCTAETITRASSLGNPDATPVLIVGMPRSGTTLVEQIISSHPAVGAGDELHFWNQRGAEWHRTGETGAPFLARTAQDYLRLLRAIDARALRVTDKMPFNFLWAGLIHMAFPNATILHCRRHAVDTALSIHQTHFHPALIFPTGGSELVQYFHGYRKLMRHWHAVLPPDRLVEVDYEELTRTPEPVIRRIIAACGLDWHDSCLRPEANQRAVRTPSKWQARQPINRNSVGRWRRYEPWLGPLRGLFAEEQAAMREDAVVDPGMESDRQV